jgi:hypothetical protein
MDRSLDGSYRCVEPTLIRTRNLSGEGKELSEEGKVGGEARTYTTAPPPDFFSDVVTRNRTRATRSLG